MDDALMDALDAAHADLDEATLYLGQTYSNRPKSVLTPDEIKGAHYLWERANEAGQGAPLHSLIQRTWENLTDVQRLVLVYPFFREFNRIREKIVNRMAEERVRP